MAQLAPGQDSPSLLQKLAGGAAAGALAQVVTNPIDLVKARRGEASGAYGGGGP